MNEIYEIDEVIEKKYTITLADGTILSDLSMNGDNFISKTPISEDIFEGNLYTVAISDGEETSTIKNMELLNLTQEGEEYWFILLEIPPKELRFRQMESNLEYIAMMSDVEL